MKKILQLSVILSLMLTGIFSSCKKSGGVEPGPIVPPVDGSGPNNSNVPLRLTQIYTVAQSMVNGKLELHDDIIKIDYDGSGRYTSISHGGDGNIVLSFTTFSYAPNGNLMEFKGKNDKGKEIKYVLTYNSLNQLIQIDYLDPGYFPIFPYTRTFKYNTEGKVIQTYTSSTNGIPGRYYNITRNYTWAGDNIVKCETSYLGDVDTRLSVLFDDKLNPLNIDGGALALILTGEPQSKNNLKSFTDGDLAPIHRKNHERSFDYNATGYAIKERILDAPLERSISYSFNK
jgi:hypothetical protein